MISSLIKGLDVDIRPYDFDHDFSTSLSGPLPRFDGHCANNAQGPLSISERADQMWNEKVDVYGAGGGGSKGKKIVSFLPPTAG